VKCYNLSKTIYGAETWTLQEIDQKNFESFEIWCWERWRSVGLIGQEMKKYYTESRRRGISYMQYMRRRANWIG
jgi:hypothetical protein